MKIVRPYAKILSADGLRTEGFYGNSAMKKIEWCARISHRMEDKQTEDSWKRFIQNVVIEHGDWSVVEHVSVSVDMLVDRGVTHELVRHRLFSFTQESTRFVNYEKKMPPSFIYPKPEVACEFCLDGYAPREDYGPEAYKNPWIHDMALTPGEGHNAFLKDCAYDFDWLHAIAEDENRYKRLLGKGWRPQEARSVLPNALASRIIITGNLRNWRHLFIMRTTQETHPQFKQVSIPLLKEFQDTFPILYADIVPLSKQSENLRLPR